VNHDDDADIIVGAPNYRVQTELRGQALAYYGSRDLVPCFSTFLPYVLKDLVGGSR
jgi:hypothetical protein